MATYAYLNCDIEDIHRVKLPDGTTRCMVALADEADVDALEAVGLVDWREDDGIDKLPAGWCDKKGNPLISVLGHEPRKITEALEPEAQPSELEGEPLNP